jgi:hypothetical protein
MPKYSGTLIAIALLVLGLYAGGQYYLSQLGKTRASEPGSVEKSVPPGYVVVNRGELTHEAAAAALRDLLDRRPSRDKLGIHYTSNGDDVHLIADRKAEVIERWSAGPGGTLVDSVWRGSLDRRLAWGREHGDFTVPDLPPPETRNLYH